MRGAVLKSQGQSAEPGSHFLSGSFHVNVEFSAEELEHATWSTLSGKWQPPPLVGAALLMVLVKTPLINFLCFGKW